MDSPSIVSEPGPSPSSVPSAMQGGGTLGRTLAVGWHIAFRFWPVAAVGTVPGLIASLLTDAPSEAKPAWKPTWPSVSSHVLTALILALIAATFLPSVMRWFADRREDTSFRRRDAQRRIRPALAAALTYAVFELLMSFGTFQAFQALPRTSPMSAWLGVALVVGFFSILWIQIRILLMLPVAVVERCGVVAAARRSWALTRGRVLTIIGVGTVLALAWLVPVIVSVQGRDGSAAVPHRFDWSATVTQIVMMPWFFAFSAVLYHDARVEHDDVDSRRIAEDAAPL